MVFQNLYSAKLAGYIQESQKYSLKINGESDHLILALDSKKNVGWIIWGEKGCRRWLSIELPFNLKQSTFQFYSLQVQISRGGGLKPGGDGAKLMVSIPTGEN